MPSDGLVGKWGDSCPMPEARRADGRVAEDTLEQQTKRNDGLVRKGIPQVAVRLVRFGTAQSGIPRDSSDLSSRRAAESCPVIGSSWTFGGLLTNLVLPQWAAFDVFADASGRVSDFVWLASVAHAARREHPRSSR